MAGEEVSSVRATLLCAVSLHPCRGPWPLLYFHLRVNADEKEATRRRGWLELKQIAYEAVRR